MAGKLRIRALLLRVSTSKGLCGVRLEFTDGLCVLRADNSTGKSTCMQAILYALGLEGMLGPSRQVPLPPAMTNVIRIDGEERRVLESEVFLEIVNGEGKIVTLQRAAKGERRPELVSVWDGPLITERGGANFQSQDYYVRQPGSAKNPAGFHSFLANYLGWQLPLVPKFDGTEAPLYIECIFPLMFVEQKKGWSAIQSTLPTYYGIRDMAKRAAEFIMDLDVYELARRRQTLEMKRNEYRTQWRVLIERAKSLVASINGEVVNLPEGPVANWPPVPGPQVVVFREEEWEDLQDAITEDEDTLRLLRESEIKNVGDTVSELRATLAEAEEKLDTKRRLADQLLLNLRAEESSLKSIDERIEALENDLVAYKDVKRLRDLGSLAHSHFRKGFCPTCERPITDMLLPSTDAANPMSVDENIAFLNEELKVVELARKNCVHAIEVYNKKFIAVRNEIRELEHQIRTAKSMLVADPRVPSATQIREMLVIEQRLENARDVAEKFDQILDDFEDVSREWAVILDKLSELPKDELSELDRRKLSYLRNVVVDQAVEYGVKSIDPNALTVSTETYKPTYEFDLQFDLSASDLIRLIWSYVYGLLELSREHSTNHLGFLILAEPRQQSAARTSIAQFLKRAGSAGRYGQQVIVATSEEKDELQEVLLGVEHSLIIKEGTILSSLDSPWG